MLVSGPSAALDRLLHSTDSSGGAPLSSQRKVGPGKKAESLYQQAALARTEGDYDKARQLFYKAIEAGAGMEVYTVFFRMVRERKWKDEALQIIEKAIAAYPNNVPFYEMYGHMERRASHYERAEEIFRQGLTHSQSNTNFIKRLAQTLVQIGAQVSLKEAGDIYKALERDGKLNQSDGFYQRFKAFQNNPRANQASDFFKRVSDVRVGITGQRNLPHDVTDIVIETSNPDLNESFGLSGAFLVRCFKHRPRPIDLRDLNKYLRSLGPQGSIVGLQDGNKVVLKSSIAFIAVPETSQVRDQVMSLLSENNETLVPVDDAIFHSGNEPLEILRELLGQFLGSRDLYNSTLPVSGRRFFGRERLLQELTDEVNRGQFLGIYGLRKMGKTSLIYQFRDEKLSNQAVAYVDLQASLVDHTKDCSPLYYELERDLYLRLYERHPEAAELLKLGKYERFSDLPDKGTGAKLLFAEDLRTFLDALISKKIPDIRRLVIVLDEIEKLLPLGGQPRIDGYMEFFGLLRGLAQTERYRGLLSNVVVAANAYLSEQGYFDGRDNPVFSFYKPIFLQPLLEDECEEMIRTLGKGMSVYWEHDAISAVFSETNGHPFLTRSLCSRITKHHPTRPLKVTASMVTEQIRPFIRDERSKLAQITELLHHNFPEEEKLLMQIALDEAPANLSDESLSHLLNYHLVTADSNGYRVTLNLLRRWLRQQAGLKE